MFVEEVGSGFPLILLHGGPGLDHTMFRPWLDPLSDEFRLLYIYQRGQGRGDRVDPATLTLSVLARDVDQLADDGAAIAKSWEDEKTVQTETEFAALIQVQMPCHFGGAVPPDFGAQTLYAPEVLRHAANTGYGDFDYPPQLERVSRPTLVIVGEHDRTTTPRAARMLHDGIR